MDVKFVVCESSTLPEDVRNGYVYFVIDSETMTIYLDYFDTRFKLSAE